MKTNDANELIKLSKKTSNARLRIRLLAIAHFKEGQNKAQIARLLKVSRRMVNLWVSKYLSDGVKALELKKQSGRPPRMSPSQFTQLSTWVNEKALSDKGGRITGMDIREYIETQFGLYFHLNHVYKLLKKEGFSWITSRSKHPKQTSEAIEVFKNL